MKKIIYVANPKTGSSTVRFILGKYGFATFESVFGADLIRSIDNRDVTLDHIPISTIKKLIEIKFPGLKFADFYVFTTIRNPWDKMTSSYRHVVQFDKKQFTFEQYLKNNGISANYHIKYMCFENDTDLCKEYIDINDITPKLKAILLKFNIINKDTKDDFSKYKLMETQKNIKYQTYYNKSAWEYIGKEFSYEINRFGYTFKDKPKNIGNVKINTKKNNNKNNKTVNKNINKNTNNKLKINKKKK